MHCQILIGGFISSKQMGHSNSVFHSAVLIGVEIGGTDPTGMSSEEPLSEASILLSNSDSWLNPYLSGNRSMTSYVLLSCSFWISFFSFSA